MRVAALVALTTLSAPLIESPAGAAATPVDIGRQTKFDPGCDCKKTFLTQCKADRNSDWMSIEEWVGIE